MLLWKHCIDKHLSTLTESAREVVLVAPFIKRHSLKRLLHGLSADAPVLCVTRWHLDELLSGVSDLEVYLDLAERKNGHMLLLNNLHAKYFRFDQDVVVGSCNITDAGLGYKENSNLELAIALQADDKTSVFEAMLVSDSVPVTYRLYQTMKDILDSMPAVKIEISETALDLAEWIPTCRSPESLYLAYMGRLSELTLAAQEASQQDLLYIRPPQGLTKQQFYAFVAGVILSSPLLAKLAKFALTPRRFGEMKRELGRILPNSSATNDWQTIMRWLLHFAPDRFQMQVANYSEIFMAKW